MEGDSCKPIFRTPWDVQNSQTLLETVLKTPGTGRNRNRVTKFYEPWTWRHLLPESFLLQVVGGFGEVGGAAEVTPIVVVGTEGEDVSPLGREAKIGGDDREGAFFGDHGQEARRNDVNTAEGQGVERR
jgi:hypothetical protein